MRALIQRVSSASVSVENKSIATIGRGLLIFVGIYSDDSINDVSKICRKIINLRIFNDVDGRISNSILNIDGEILLVSQFTLCADTKRGNRPSFNNAMKSDQAIGLFERLKNMLNNSVNVKAGRFGANMQVSIINDGPVTIMLDTRNENE